jgi:translation elongation factor EF-Tu-like GTPase
MARRLFVVEDSFLIKGRGLVPVPGIVPRGDERFRVGDHIVIRRPDGSQLEWTIGGIEIFRTPPRPNSDLGILLEDLNKDDVPIGSEVWSADA